MIKFISNLGQDDIAAAKDAKLPGLIGAAAFCEIATAVSSIKEYPHYVRQAAVNIKNKRLMVPYIHETFARQINGKRAVIPTCALYPMLKERAKKYSTSIFVYLHIVGNKEFPQVVADIFYFNKGHLTNIESRMNITYSNITLAMQKVITDCKKAEFSNADCIILSNDDLTEQFSNQSYAHYFVSTFFHPKQGAAGLIQRWFGAYAGDKVMSNHNSSAVNLFKQYTSTIALLFVIASIPAVYGMVKWYQFTQLKNEFLALNPSGDAEHHYQLGLWEARKAYVAQLGEGKSASGMSISLLKSALKASSDIGFNVKLFRIDLHNTEEIIVNKAAYNAILELGIPPQPGRTNEYLVEQYAKAFSEALGNTISGSVDIWDDITLRSIGEQNLVHIRLYVHYVGK
jgi:hypothetical protein